ncbi:hypothetical protein [Pseudomonas botevensis]|uniref:hypothetical protein n=1 Tax=Pseudomonas botevensis TaxID=2842352 RepID=UPI001CED1CC7|nr:hypothetical protein [Pseudomonas botevensis]
MKGGERGESLQIIVGGGLSRCVGLPALMMERVFIDESRKWKFRRAVQMICPRCQQDYIAQARIKVTETVIFICPECDSIWFGLEKIGRMPFLDYGTYMEGIGLSGLWDELEILVERI